MCTAIIANGKRTVVGWNLDILDTEYKVVAENGMVYIAVNDATEGWLPLFGANSRGDFVTMPTCWPFDERSNPKNAASRNIILLNIDLLLGKKTLAEIKDIAENEPVCSVPGLTFQAQLSDRAGNVLQIVPGQGVRYFEKPEYSVMTNFSPFKGDAETHPWMGMDRYNTAVEMLNEKHGDIDAGYCFEILKRTSQTVCPTVVSMVYDAEEHAVYWCENREWDKKARKRKCFGESLIE